MTRGKIVIRSEIGMKRESERKGERCSATNLFDTLEKKLACNIKREPQCGSRLWSLG